MNPSTFFAGLIGVVIGVLIVFLVEWFCKNTFPHKDDLKGY